MDKENISANGRASHRAHMFARSHKLSARLLAVLTLAAALLVGATMLRGAEYDEQYTMLLLSGTPRPVWPEAIFTAGEARAVEQGHTSLATIASDLRTTDVHPPLYFWAAAGWRDLVGTGLVRSRLLSALLGLGALVAVGFIARASRVPPILATLFTLGCYGFLYTGAIARGFALAQLLSLCGVALLLLAKRRDGAWIALAGGLALGAATFANYLAAFVGLAALAWLVLCRIRVPRLWLAAALGFALFLPADLWFFVAQRTSREGQFPPFQLLDSLMLLGRFYAGALAGGLPLYAHGMWRMAAAGAVSGLLAGLAVLIVWRWRRLAPPGPRLLLAACAAAPPVGLLLLGFVFDTTPIELRYLAFATPFAALLLAGAIASLPRNPALVLAALVLSVQAASVVGLLTRPETMQPARATAAAAGAWPDALVLIPRGNDGVGIVGAFARETLPATELLVVDRGERPEHIRRRVASARRVVLALLEQDDTSRDTAHAMLAAFGSRPCWRRIGVGFNVLAYARVCEED
jgi:4-amino-4-deoxy-L-arabinose transferase-like glycosyltransferase